MGGFCCIEERTGETRSFLMATLLLDASSQIAPKLAGRLSRLGPPSRSVTAKGRHEDPLALYYSRTFAQNIQIRSFTIHVCCCYSSQMRNIRLLFCLSLLVIGFGSYKSHAQAPPPPGKAPVKPEKVREVGKAEVNWLEHRNLTVASVSVYLVGSLEEVSESKDVLRLTARFRSEGRKVTQPAHVELGLTSYSQLRKYAVDNHLTITADGQTILSQKVPLVPGASGAGSEHFAISIGYQDFVKLANAKKAVIQFGGTTIELTGEMSQALKDLDATIAR